MGPAARWLAFCGVAAALGGCQSTVESVLADFVDVPYGVPDGDVTSLGDEGLAALMTEVATRIVTYADLRDAVGLENMARSHCMTVEEQGNGYQSYWLDAACAFGDEEPASGRVHVQQSFAETEPVQVLESLLRYESVIVGDLRVDGIEDILDTFASDGTSRRDLDVVQDGHALRYEFRVAETDDGVPLLDYLMPAPSGDILVRAVLSTVYGPLATVFLTGRDGVLECELRDTVQEVGDEARGTCEGGIVFGL